MTTETYDLTGWMSLLGIAVASSLAIFGCDPAADLMPASPEAMALSAEKDPAARLAEEAAVDFEALVAAGGSTPVTELIDELKNAADVKDARLSIDGSTIIIELTNGERVSVFTDEKHRPQWQNAGSGRPVIADSPLGPPTSVRTDPGLRKAQATFSEPVDFIICDETSFPQAQKACVVLNFPDQFNQDSSNITTPLRRAGYSVDVIRLQTIADVKSFQDSLGDCGVIYISSHGGVGKTRLGQSANILATEIEIAQGAALPSQMQEILGAYSGTQVNQYLAITGAGGKAYWGLTPEFFQQATYKNTMVFVDACQSDKAVGAGGEQLKDAFLSKGAGSFIGWNESISTKFSNPAVAAIFDGLAPVDIGVESMTIFTNPTDPGAGQSYVPTLQVQPPAAGIEVRMSIVGSDFFRRSETKVTDSFGEVEFASVPGGKAGVTDTLTAVTGGADNASTVIEVAVKNNPTLPESCKLLWQSGTVSIANLTHTLRTGANASFNLVCNNPDITTTDTIIKF